MFIEERNNTWNSPYLFNGKELDEDTGLYYYGARYYNPRESIFLSVDQMVEMTMTPYQYAYQNPVNYTDPTGMMPEGDPDRASTGTSDTYHDAETGTTYHGNNNGDWSYTDSNGGLVVVGNPSRKSSGNGTATTPDGKIYGGDGSGSFHDWSLKAAFALNRYNPVSNVWDGISGWLTGADRFGNPLSKEESSVNIAMAIPIGKAAGVVSNVGKTGLKVTKDGATAIVGYWPKNGGALGKWEREFLMPGTEIDRFGSGFGKYFSPRNTPMDMRALPGLNTGTYNSFRVVKPFEVQSSTIAPAFGKIGLGKQYFSPVNMNILLKRGIIVPIK